MNYRCFYCQQQFPRYTHGGKRICDACRVARHRDAKRAARKVLKAMQAGRLPRADAFACADCGEQAQCYDHRDLSQPLKVDPVCISCNSRRGPAAWAPGCYTPRPIGRPRKEAA